MNGRNEEYRTLLRRSLIVTASCIGAVVICYFWVDRAVAFFVYDHHINQIQVFRWLTYPPPEVQNWAALMATEKELTTVPGIGHVIAFRIIAARPFRSADDLKRVSGIGEKKYAQIRPYFQ